MRLVEYTNKTFILCIKYFVDRLQYVSDISKDIAQVFFGVLAIESFTKQHINWTLIQIGVILAVIWWFFGIISFRIKE